MKKVLQTIDHSIGIDKQNFDLKIVNNFLSISINIYFGCSLTLKAPIATKVVCFSRLLKC